MNRKKKRAQAPGLLAESTMQLPIGVHSVLSELEAKAIKGIEAAVVIALTWKSNWDSGKTRWISQRQLAKLLGVSRRYLQPTLKASGFIEVIHRGIRGVRYQLRTHLCPEGEDMPVDKNEKPLKMAVPVGAGSVFHHLEAGAISWKDLLLWMLLKWRCDWKTGTTGKFTRKNLAERLGFGVATIRERLSRLEQVGLIKVLEGADAGKFEVFPKLQLKSKNGRDPGETGSTLVQIRGDWRVSRNGRVRASVKTGEWQQRVGKVWKAVRDRDWHVIPRAIRNDLTRALDVYAQIPLKLRGI